MMQMNWFGPLSAVCQQPVPWSRPWSTGYLSPGYTVRARARCRVSRLRLRPGAGAGLWLARGDPYRALIGPNTGGYLVTTGVRIPLVTMLPWLLSGRHNKLDSGVMEMSWWSSAPVSQYKHQLDRAEHPDTGDTDRGEWQRQSCEHLKSPQQQRILDTWPPVPWPLRECLLS